MLAHNALKNLYQLDYHQWLLDTIELLKDQKFDQLDYENLSEELEALGRSEKRSVESLLEQILIHLLLYQYWISERQYNGNHWCGEIATFRNQLHRYLDSRTLKNYLENRLTKVYQDALRVVKIKTALKDFPLDCPYTFEQILDHNYFP
jgi:hypothetical protein